MRTADECQGVKAEVVHIARTVVAQPLAQPLVAVAVLQADAQVVVQADTQVVAVAVLEADTQ